MNCQSEACAHLRQVVADLVSSAQSDLRPMEKLELLCVQIGTAQHWLDQLECTGPAGHVLAGPHFSTIEHNPATPAHPGDLLDQIARP